MDKTTKTILIVLGSILLVCACATAALFATGLWSFTRFVIWADESVSESSQVAVRVGSEIADFEVPAGFASPYSVHFGDVSMVGYESQNGSAHLLLAKFPDETSINVSEVLRQISEGRGDPQSVWYRMETTLIEEKPVTIRGQERILSIAEGTSSEGVIYRTATATFEGRNGPALVMLASPIAEWDLEMVETFLASIE
jgi:hypothetical protein